MFRAILLDEPESLLQGAMRVLCPNGRLVILTPTGNGRLWAATNPLAAFAKANQLNYDRKTGFQGLAIAETVTFEEGFAIL